MLNKKLYFRLTKVYESEPKRFPTSLADVERTGMVLAGRTILTRGEKEACLQVFEEIMSLVRETDGRV